MFKISHFRQGVCVELKFFPLPLRFSSTEISFHLIIFSFSFLIEAALKLHKIEMIHDLIGEVSQSMWIRASACFRTSFSCIYDDDDIVCVRRATGKRTTIPSRL